MGGAVCCCRRCRFAHASATAACSRSRSPCATAQPGEVRPQNPIAQVRIATDPADGFTIGPDAQHLVTIVPLGLRADAPSATVFAGQMLFADARDSADLLIRPSVTGVQTFEQLTERRGTASRSPTGLSSRAAKPPRWPTASCRSVKTASCIAQSAPPVAIDAEQRPVPVTISLADNVVRLDVPHRQGGFVYPIAVDPDWTSTYDYYEQPGLGLEGWHPEGQIPETPPAYYNAAVNRNWDGTEPGRDKLGFVIKPIASPGGRDLPDRRRRAAGLQGPRHHEDPLDHVPQRVPPQRSRSPDAALRAARRELQGEQRRLRRGSREHR